MDAHICAMKKMKRTYTLRKRAEQQAETRRRIVEAAVDLHTRLGPAQTSLSMVAEQAGVQRHTLYAHFPDERSLLMACSGHTQAADPPPDAEPLRAETDPSERLRVGLAALYDWYGRNAQRIASVLRDAEHHAPTREIAALRMGPYMKAYGEVLGANLDARQRAFLTLAMSFHTWRTLTRDGGLTPEAAVEAMVRAIEAAKS
jgi:AcrR family transcriptional regulator